jgi:hypothetical protein
MDYFDLNTFINKISNGELCPGIPMDIRNLGGNHIHRISFMDHCDHLCKKHDTNRLKLLSVIQQKINGDMLIRLSKSPVLNTKLGSVLNEWGETDLDPTELFRCPDSCYDESDISSLLGEIQGFDKELSLLDDNVDDSSLYENVERLRNNYHGCFNRLGTHLTELEERNNEYEPSHKAVFVDLSTKHKPFYLDDLLQSTEQENMTEHVNKKINRHVPDNIHTIFLNNVLIPTLIKKEMEGYKNKCMKMKTDVEGKQQRLDDIMERIGPDEPLSVGLVKLLTDIGEIFNLEPEPGELSDDYSSEDELDKLKDVMNKAVNKQDLEVQEEDNDEEKEDFYLELPQSSLKEKSPKEKSPKKSQTGGADILSFF